MAPPIVTRGFLLGAPLEVISLILQFAATTPTVFKRYLLVCHTWRRAIEADSHLRCCLLHLRLRPGDLEFGRRIATASYGIVRLAHHRFTGATFALKTIDAAMGWDRVAVVELNPFTLPCRHLLSPLLSWVEGEEPSYLPTNQSLMLVEEYCDRGSLMDICAVCKDIPEKILAGIAKQMCSALAFLHRTGWRSRSKRSYDLTPADFMFDSNGTLKLSATPVAKSCNAGALSPDVKKIYLAPELIMGQPWLETADSWAVGLILLELALGSYPFTSSKQLSLINEITQCKAIQFPMRLSRAGLDFLVSCVAPRPEERPRMARLLRRPWLQAGASEAEIARWLQGLPKPKH